MSIEPLASLKALHLYGMALAWSKLQSEGFKQAPPPERWMERLIAAEQAHRQAKSLCYQLRARNAAITNHDGTTGHQRFYRHSA